jgi:hypothetical protein
MKTLTFAVAALAALVAASTADARPPCDNFVCGSNGTQLTGIARPALEAKRPVVNAVTLPSGETVNMR